MPMKTEIIVSDKIILSYETSLSEIKKDDKYSSLNQALPKLISLAKPY